MYFIQKYLRLLFNSNARTKWNLQQQSFCRSSRSADFNESVWVNGGIEGSSVRKGRWAFKGEQGQYDITVLLLMIDVLFIEEIENDANKWKILPKWGPNRARHWVNNGEGLFLFCCFLGGWSRKINIVVCLSRT